MKQKKRPDKMTNDEFLKDFEQFQQEWDQENDEWFAEVSTMMSTQVGESPSKSLKSFKPKQSSTKAKTLIDKN